MTFNHSHHHIFHNPYTMKNLLEKVNAALEGVAYPKIPEGLYEPIQYALSMGGKRIRPTLLLLCHSLYSDDTDYAIAAALAIETYHNHTLLHDDVMDNADVRRGMPTVHKKWDANTAILSGDAMLITAFKHLAEYSGSVQEELLQLFIKTTLEVCEGQQYDMNFERLECVGIAEYLEMIRLKTSVLLACAAKMGAITGGAPRTEADMLYAFAEKVGLAFQLQDDLLDTYGDPAVFGKNIGGDILCAKKTYLLLTALQKANAAQKAELQKLLADKIISPSEKIEKVIALYNQLHVAKDCEEAIEAYYHEARYIYETLPIHESKKAPLWQWAESLMNREK